MSAADDCYIALLRGVNVGGRSLPMAELRELVTGLGFGDVRTLLQSGNLLFRAAPQPPADLERRLEAATAQRFDTKPDFMLRTPSEWADVIAANPFPDAARDMPSKLIVMFLKDAPAPEQIAALQAAITTDELVTVLGREAYIVYPTGQGRSLVTTNMLEKHLRTRATGRNWNTVQKIAALLDG